MRKDEGFTIAELLIVVAIIGVLVGVSIPILTNQLEKSRQAVDLTNMRNAKGAAVLDYSINGSNGEYLKYYDAGSGEMVDTLPLGYGKSRTYATRFYAVMDRTYGKPFSSSPNALLVNISTDGFVTMSWVGTGDEAYLAASTPFRGEGLRDLKKLPNAERVKADRAALAGIGNEILSKHYTLDSLYTDLGILTSGTKGNSDYAIRIADYYQQKSGTYTNDAYTSDGFRLDSKNTNKLKEILDDIGYDGGSSKSGTTSMKDSNAVIYENSLFYSDELANNQFKSETKNNVYEISKNKRSIILDHFQTRSDGQIVGFDIYSKAMDNQSNLGDNEKAKFRVTVTASGSESMLCVN